PQQEDIYQIGTIAKIKQLLKMPGNIVRVLVEGQERGTIKEIIQEEPFLSAKVEEVTYHLEESKEVEARKDMVIDVFQDYMTLSRSIQPETRLTISNIEDYGKRADIILANLELKLEEQQELLEMIAPYKRLEFLYGKLLQEIEKLTIEKSIDQKVK